MSQKTYYGKFFSEHYIFHTYTRVKAKIYHDATSLLWLKKHIKILQTGLVRGKKKLKISVAFPFKKVKIQDAGKVIYVIF